MSGQALAFGFEPPNQDWVVFVYKQIGQSLFWAMAFVGCLTKGILAWREYVTSHLAFGQWVKYIAGNLAKHYISEVAKAAEQCHQMQPSLNKAAVRYFFGR